MVLATNLLLVRRAERSQRILLCGVRFLYIFGRSLCPSSDCSFISFLLNKIVVFVCDLLKMLFVGGPAELLL